MNSKSLTSEPMRSGQLARLAGVSTDTLRYYERKRLLPLPRRSANGYRQYPPDALARVRLVRRALSIGFGTDELARVLKVRDEGGAPCRAVRQLAAAKLMELEGWLRDATLVREVLRKTLKDWDKHLATTPTGRQAKLLEALAQTSEGRDGRNSRLPRMRGVWSKKTKERNR